MTLKETLKKTVDLKNKMNDDFDSTQKIPRKFITERIIPTICSECGKIYRFRKCSVKDSKELGASKGICPDCEKDFNYEDDMTQKIPRNFVDDKTIPSICSYCGAIYKIDTWVVENGKKVGVTHGMCPKCYEKMKQSL